MKPVLLAVLLMMPLAVLAQVKKPEPPAKEPSYSTALQAVMVTTRDWESFRGTARLYERKDAGSKWKKVGDDFPVVIGRNGMGIDESDGWDVHLSDIPKREGDGKSPAGIIPLTYAFGRPQKPADLMLDYRRLAESTECVDDVKSSHYNKLVDRYQVGNFDWKSSEKMLEVGDQYDLGVFVAYNSYPAVPGFGSCIFLHIWKNSETGTAGCTAMSRENLERILKWLDPAKNPHLIQMPMEAYPYHRKKWNLPKL